MYREAKGESDRLYSGGYQDLCTLTGLSKRGIQNIIGELQEKSVLTLERPPGHHRSEVSVYRVPSERSVLQRWYDAGYRYVAGKGRVLQ